MSAIARMANETQACIKGNWIRIVCRSADQDSQSARGAVGRVELIDHKQYPPLEYRPPSAVRAPDEFAQLWHFVFFVRTRRPAACAAPGETHIATRQPHSAGGVETIVPPAAQTRSRTCERPEAVVTRGRKIGRYRQAGPKGHLCWCNRPRRPAGRSRGAVLTESACAKLFWRH